MIFYIITNSELNTNISITEYPIFYPIFYHIDYTFTNNKLIF